MFISMSYYIEKMRKNVVAPNPQEKLKAEVTL